MAITIEQIIQRLKEIYSAESEKDKDVGGAINYLRRNPEGAHEYIEYLRNKMNRGTDGAGMPSLELPHKLWMEYAESDSFSQPISSYFLDDDSPPAMIEYAIETLVNEEVFNKWEGIPPEPKKTSGSDANTEPNLGQTPELIEEQLDAKSNMKAEYDKHFELKGQIMCFSDGTKEVLNDTEKRFVETIIENSKQGLMADADAFTLGSVYARRAVIRAEIKKKYPSTSELIKSKRGKKGYCIPTLFPTSNK